MALVDAQGRLFGRLNLLDALLLVFALGLVPLGYTAYALFRTPPPVLIAIEPSAVPFEPSLRVTIRGEHLRPYMRVSFGSHQGRTFLFKSVNEAEVDISELGPGVYDVVLYDFAQEQSRLPNAFTVTASAVPPRELLVVGMLANLTKEQAAAVSAPMALAGFGQVERVGRPLPELTRVHAGRVLIEVPLESGVRVPMAIRMRCAVRTPEGRPDCVAGGVVLQPDAVLTLPTPVGPRPFQIDQVLGPQPLEPVAVRVRFSADPAVLARMAAGDVDLGLAANELAAGVRVTRAQSADGGSREALLTVHAQQGTAGWTYGGLPLRVGGALTFRAPGYEVSGVVLSVTRE